MDDKKDLRAFFDKKKKAKKNLVVVAVEVEEATSKARAASGDNSTNVAVKATDNGWVDEVESEQIAFDTGGKAIVDMSKDATDSTPAAENEDENPLPIKFDAEKTWGGRATEEEAKPAAPAAAATAAAPAKFVVRAKLAAQGPPKLSEFPELGAVEPEPPPKKKTAAAPSPAATSSGGSASSTSSASASSGEKYRPPGARGGGFDDRDRDRDRGDFRR